MKKINIERCIELENWVKENKDKTMTIEETIKKLLIFFEEDREYVFNSITMPKEEIEKAIEYYDSHKFPDNIDELLFVNTLAYKYNVSRDRVIERIQEVRRLKNTEKGQVRAKKRKKYQK